MLPLTNQLGVDGRLMWVFYGVTIPAFYVYTYYANGISRLITTPYEVCASVLAFAILLFDEACREADLKQVYDTLTEMHHRDTLHAGDLHERGEDVKRARCNK
jgi:hypothetical protein